MNKFLKTKNSSTEIQITCNFYDHFTAKDAQKVAWFSIHDIQSKASDKANNMASNLKTHHS